MFINLIWATFIGLAVFIMTLILSGDYKVSVAAGVIVMFLKPDEFDLHRINARLDEKDNDEP